jgi:hypothetical protein
MLKKYDAAHNCRFEICPSFFWNGLTIEEKLASDGSIVALSIDWRQAESRHTAQERALQILSYCETLPVVCVRYEGQSFFDVFSCSIDEGKALLTLKQNFGLLDGILYMGDSGVDNAAFEVADVAVGVLHEETPPNLFCDFFVKFEDVAAFLANSWKIIFALTRNPVFSP